jgi:ribonuclease P protein component
MAPQHFPPELRLRQRADFDRVFAARKSVADGRLVVYAAPNDLPYPRIGLVVSKKHGTAARRNRYKRLLREAFRRRREQLPGTGDFVVLPRVGAPTDFEELATSLVALFRRALAKTRPRSSSQTSNKRDSQ